MHTPRFATASLLLCVCAIAPKIAMADPSIGSYFYFVALDRMCPTPSADRAAALEKFKRHFFSNVRAMLVDPALKAPPEAHEKVSKLERDGPTTEDLASFNKLFAGAKADELTAECARVPRDIADRIWMEEQLAEAARKARERMK